MSEEIIFEKYLKTVREDWHNMLNPEKAVLSKDVGQKLDENKKIGWLWATAMTVFLSSWLIPYHMGLPDVVICCFILFGLTIAPYLIGLLSQYFENR